MFRQRGEPDAAFHARKLGEFEAYLDEKAHEIGVLLVEPQWGSSAAAMPWPPELLRAYIGATKQRGIPVISDEIMCGLGRHGQEPAAPTGTGCFLAECWNLDVDAVTFGKAIGGGAGHLLSGAVLLQGADKLKEAKHGTALQSHTYAGSSSRALLNGQMLLDSLPQWRPAVQTIGETLSMILDELQEESGGAILCHGQGAKWGGMFTHEDPAARLAANPHGGVINQLVPRNGEAPLPRWINDQDFCSQLFKVHGDIPDSRVGLYGPDSMMWRLTSRVTPAAMGAGRALLLQTAHPWITAGIDEHSIVRYDPLERGRRTFIYVSTLVYGSMPQVMSAAHTVHKIHNAIEGQIPYEAGAFKKGSDYGANEVSAMIWVSATLWDTLVRMYEEYEEPLTDNEKAQFYEEIKLFNMMFGIPESAMPRDWAAFVDYNETMWYSPQLTVTENAKALKEDLFNQNSILLAFPLWVQEVATAVNLPAPVREQYDMDYGLWYTLNYYGWIKPSSKLYNWLMPDSIAVNPVYHEAQARLRGERVGWYQQKIISAAGVERLVN
ncbi:MAG: hypothetical protein CMK79_01950 [Pseudomonadales bacterium]|nr:hypothetical protein [Pseudomonadales bacterium]